MEQILEEQSFGKFKTRQANKIKKLYSLYDREPPEKLFALNRMKRKEIISMLEKEYFRPTITQDEMFMIIESIPVFDRGRPRNTKNSKFKVGKITNYKQAMNVVVSLSSPSKMPCYGYNLPAKFCITGSKLAKVKNTICNGCYALKGWYKMKWVQDAMLARLKSIWHPDWSDAMTWLIKFHKQDFFRWHDSGDLQSIQHLSNILNISKKLPDVKFWLPTREYSIVDSYWKKFANGKYLSDLFPNISIRLSANEFDGEPPIQLAKKIGVQVSKVSTNCPSCPAHQQDDQCKDCRNCWDTKQFCITYVRH